MSDDLFFADLGKLLRETRELKGMIRAKLAKITDMSVNTLAAYEKVGEEGGKMPTANKLAKICIVLEIDPRIALMSSLEDKSFEMGPEPGTPEAKKPYWNLTRYGMRDFISKLENGSKAWIDTLKIIGAQQDSFLMLKDEIGALVLDLKNQRKSGSVHDDLSRPDISTNNQEAVGAAPISHDKGGG